MVTTAIQEQQSYIADGQSFEQSLLTFAILAKPLLPRRPQVLNIIRTQPLSWFCQRCLQKSDSEVVCDVRTSTRAHSVAQGGQRRRMAAGSQQRFRLRRLLLPTRRPSDPSQAKSLRQSRPSSWLFRRKRSKASHLGTRRWRSSVSDQLPS